MKPELEAELFAIEPKWFDRDPKSRNSLMAYGFTCGDGWFDLIRTLLLVAKHRLDMCDLDVKAGRRRYNPFDQFQVTQVKEKFGTLRFHYEGGDDEFHGAATMAEVFSGHVCEDCGGKGKRRDIRGWLAALCDRCAMKRRKRK